MFTGIIESLGEVVGIVQNQSNITFEIKADFIDQIKIDQSIAHDGVCLTVIDKSTHSYKVTAIDETLSRTNLNTWKIGYKPNLERCMKADGRFDGHIVQGHVDTIATCTKLQESKGSWLLGFSYQNNENITVEKGSITINGISLTVVESENNYFSVAIIPYTWLNTNLQFLELGKIVNIEFDIIGKYLKKMYFSTKI
jgi:riboflavin synthase